MFRSTKIIELGSCAFRQPNASHSHCRFIHGYKLQAKFWFEATELDKNNWVVDFGGLKQLKKTLQNQFDHTTCLAADDPVLPIFKELVKADACDLRIMPKGTGVERIAEWCFEKANEAINTMTEGRCRCYKVEVFEHENNSAIFECYQEKHVATDQANQLKLNLNNQDDEQPAMETSIKPTQTNDAVFSSNANKQTNTWIDKSAPSNSWRF